MTNFFVKTHTQQFLIEGVETIWDTDERTITFNRLNDEMVLTVNRDELEYYFVCDLDTFICIDVEIRRGTIHLRERDDVE